MDGKRHVGIPQEMLKLIACITMLLDHVGASVYPSVILRSIGRLSFPIYCFLLTEGAYYTKDPKRYAGRMAIGMLLSELPYDFLFSGQVDWGHQSVMSTLLLAYLAIWAGQKTDDSIATAFLLGGAALVAEYLRCDYGAMGVVMVAGFWLSRNAKHRLAIQTVLVAAVCLLIPSMTISVFGVRIPIQVFGLLAMVPVACYNGCKLVRSKGVQTAFYLFYPAHLAILALAARGKGF